MSSEINFSVLANTAAQVGSKPLVFGTHVSSGAGDAVYKALDAIRDIARGEKPLSVQSQVRLLSALLVLTDSGVQLPSEVEQIFRLAHDRLVEIVGAGGKGDSRPSLDKAPAVVLAPSDGILGRRVQVLKWGALLGLIPESADPLSPQSIFFQDRQGRGYMAAMGASEREMILNLLTEMSWPEIISQFRSSAFAVQQAGLRDILVFGPNENFMGGFILDKAEDFSPKSRPGGGGKGKMLHRAPQDGGHSDDDSGTPCASHNARVWAEAQQGGVDFVDDAGAALQVQPETIPQIIPAESANNNDYYVVDLDESVGAGSPRPQGTGAETTPHQRMLRMAGQYRVLRTVTTRNGVAMLQVIGR